MKAGTAEKTAARAMGKYRKRGFILAFLTPCTILFLIVYAYPLITIFLTSFCKWNYENFTAPEFLGWSNLFDNYSKLFRYDANFKMALVNSLKWVALTLLIQVPFTILVALTLSKKMRGWKFTRNMFLIPNIISTAAIGLIFLNLYSPARGIVTELCNLIWPGSDVSVLSNSKYAFWGVTFTFILFGGSNCLLLLTQIFSIDPAVYEAARIDGASEAKTFISIVLPMVKPGIGALAIFTFINSWNDYFMQLIMLSSTSNLTISLGIAKLQAENSTDFGLIMAGAALAAVPIIIIFLIFQKYFTKGIAMGAVKG